MFSNYQTGKELFTLHTKLKSKLSNVIEGSLRIKSFNVDPGNLFVDGGITVNLNTLLKGNVLINNDLNIIGDEEIDNDLLVNGNLTVNDATILNGVVFINNNLNINGNVNLLKDLTIEGSSLFKNNVLFNGGSLVTFTIPPIFTGDILEITKNNQLTTKEYVDESIKKNLTWWGAIDKFWNFSSGYPEDLILGKRYISETTYETFTINYVYEYDGVNFNELIPIEGVILYCKEGLIHADETIIYTSNNTWVNAGYSIKGVDHEALSNINKTAINHKTHTDIDNHISNSTTAHFNQELTTTGDVEFNTLILSNKTPLISDYTLEIIGNSNITGTLNVNSIQCSDFSYISKNCLIDINTIQTNFNIYVKTTNNELSVLIPNITLLNINVPINQLIILKIISESGILFSNVVFTVPAMYLFTVQDIDGIVLYKKYGRIYYNSNELCLLNEIGESLFLDVEETVVNILIEQINIIGLLI